MQISQIIKDTSIINNRLDNKLNISIIDRETERLRNLLQDDTLHPGFVAKITKSLSEHEINSFADYAVRRGSNKGRAFVGLCEKIMREKNKRY